MMIDRSRHTLVAETAISSDYFFLVLDDIWIFIFLVSEVAVLVSGSGARDRDGKFFMVLRLPNLGDNAR